MMTTGLDHGPTSLLEPGIDDGEVDFSNDTDPFAGASTEREQPVRPINWSLLTADEAETE